jgi:alcohol dehydrogenase (cytochrome c)/quinohemoprotein ethanol dehydrogenase
MWLALPGPLGGHNWQPMSFSPKTNLVYIPAHDVPFGYLDQKDFVAHPLGFNVGINAEASSMPQDPAVKTPTLALYRGYLKAWDPVAQKEAWSIEHPGGWNGGVLSTAGNLVFQGNSAGFFVAYDATNGQKLWSFSAQTGVIAAPMSYAVGGQQYVAIVAGWGGAYAITGGDIAHKGSLAVNRSRVLAFRLGANAKLPDAPPPPEVKAPTPPFGTDADVAAGKTQYHTYCNVCHGDAAVGAGVTPDLRWSDVNKIADRWQKIVLDGVRTNQGMVGFAKVLTPAQADTIRAYVVFRANESYKEQAAAKAAATSPSP